MYDLKGHFFQYVKIFIFLFIERDPASSAGLKLKVVIAMGLTSYHSEQRS